MSAGNKQITGKELIVLITAIRPSFREAQRHNCDERDQGQDLEERMGTVNVAKECAEHGVDRFIGKSVAHIRDDVFGYRKKKVKAKYDAAKKSGAAPAEYKDREKEMLDLLARKTNELDGIPVAESFSVNGQTQQLTAEENERYDEFMENSKDTSVEYSVDEPNNYGLESSGSQPLFGTQCETPANIKPPPIRNFLLPQKPQRAQKRLFPSTAAPLSPKSRKVQLQNSSIECLEISD